jgi:hypothetical protein
MLPDMLTRFGATAYLHTTKARCRTRRKIRCSAFRSLITCPIELQKPSPLRRLSKHHVVRFIK